MIKCYGYKNGLCKYENIGCQCNGNRRSHKCYLRKRRKAIRHSQWEFWVPELADGKEVLRRYYKEVIKRGDSIEEFRRDLDEEIRDLVIDLVRNGYMTTWSCAGHGSRGVIGLHKQYITGPEDYARIARIIRRHTDVDFEFKKGPFMVGHYSVEDIIILFKGSVRKEVR